MSQLPSAAEIKSRFERDGYFKPVRLISKSQAHELRLKVEDFERRHPDKAGFLDMKPSLLFPWLDTLIRNPVLLEALDPLLGPDILCENTCFRNKAADSKTYVSWHQDTPYLPIRPLLVTSWLAITPATKENGCLRVIPGSHKWPKLLHKEKTDPDSMLTRGHYISEPFDEALAVDLELEAGQAVMLHFNIVHSSQPNRSNDRRMGMLIDCIPASAVKDGNRESALLIKGTDHWKHFDHEMPPTVDFGTDEQARHRRAVELVTNSFYSGSGRVPEALSGKARNRI